MKEWGPVFDETRSRSNFRPTAVIVMMAVVMMTTVTAMLDRHDMK